MKPPFIWDVFSDQPKVILDRLFKRHARFCHWQDYLKMLFVSGLVYPASLLNLPFMGVQNNRKDYKELVGLGINLDKGNAQFDLIAELNVKHVLIRLPLWDLKNLKNYKSFADQLYRNGTSLLINLLQDREHVNDPELLRKNANHIFEEFAGLTTQFQIGNAINRIKWGFFSVEEYLNFYRIIQELRDSRFPGYELLGPSVIDFEFYFTIRALFNSWDIRFDRLSALLYVDRMGAPDNKQYGLFDCDLKMKMLCSLARLSAKVQKKSVYITEVNWPLVGTFPYAPTSSKECVTESQYANYMVRYLQIAQQNPDIDRVYWHQLIAPGYGLVDDRDGQLRKRPAFSALRQLLA